MKHFTIQTRTEAEDFFTAVRCGDDGVHVTEAGHGYLLDERRRVIAKVHFDVTNATVSKACGHIDPEWHELCGADVEVPTREDATPDSPFSNYYCTHHRIAEMTR